MEMPPLSVSFYMETAMECQPWPSRNKSMFEVLSIIAQAVWTVRQESRQGSLAYFQPVGPARMRAQPRRNSTPPRSAAGADQRTPAAASDLSAAAAEFSGLVFTAAIADGRAHAPRGIVLTEAKVKETGSWPHRKTVDAARLFRHSKPDIPRKGSRNGIFCQRVKCAYLNTITISKEIFGYVCCSK